MAETGCCETGSTLGQPALDLHTPATLLAAPAKQIWIHVGLSILIMTNDLFLFLCILIYMTKSEFKKSTVVSAS